MEKATTPFPLVDDPLVCFKWNKIKTVRVFWSLPFQYPQIPAAILHVFGTSGSHTHTHTHTHTHKHAHTHTTIYTYLFLYCPPLCRHYFSLVLYAFCGLLPQNLYSLLSKSFISNVYFSLNSFICLRLLLFWIRSKAGVLIKQVLIKKVYHVVL